MSATSSASFSVAKSRAIVNDLFRPNLLIYWTDLLVSVSVAYGFATIYLLMPTWAPLGSPQHLFCFLAAGFALHRVANFIHEVAHLRTNRSMRSFIVGWNLIVGVLTLMPSYFFDKHIDHHNSHVFGTRQDCEYVPLGRGAWWGVALFLGQLFLQPLFVIFRFVILTPISFLHPRLREWVLVNFSSFVFLWPCPRQLPDNAPRAAWATMDVLCWLRATAIFATVLVGLNPWYRIPQLYALACFTLFLHYFRSLAAHRYLSDGKRHGFLDQLWDSIDIQGDYVCTELLFPIGLRYHALHHLFPAMPYHNLGRAHRRLLAQLPAESPYRGVVYPNFRSVLKELLIHEGRPRLGGWARE